MEAESEKQDKSGVEMVEGPGRKLVHRFGVEVPELCRRSLRRRSQRSATHFCVPTRPWSHRVHLDLGRLRASLRLL